MLPADWRERMVEMIRGAAPLEGAWFTGSAFLAPDAQIAVYREQFVLRMTEALDGELPGLRALLGDALDPLYDAFLADHPPSSWSLDHIALPFADWLEARGAELVAVEMARLDAAVMAVFGAEDAPELDPATLSPDRPLRLGPQVRLLRLGHDLHRLRSAALEGQAHLAPTPGDHRLAIYRLEREVRHWELDGLAHAVLDAFRAPRPLSEAAARALAVAPEAADRLGPTFHEIARRRLLVAAAP